MIFLGEFKHTLDAKNRLFIPAKFREGLGESFVVFPAPDGGGCLFFYTEEAWVGIVEQFKQLSANTSSRSFQRRLLQGVTSLIPDKQGRITLNPYHVERAGLEKDVVIFGAMGRVEVWNPDRYQSQLELVTDTELDEYGFIF